MITSICPADNSTLFVAETPLWQNGWTFHTLGLTIALAFGGVAALIALLLVFLHGIHYSRPYEQKHIIRILMMIPIYAVISFLSFLYYQHTVYWQVIRDCYEAFAIASFFTLMCHYIAPSLHEQKNYFRTATPKNWFWGVFGLQKCTGGKTRGPFRVPRSGLTWFNIVWIGVFQYCFVRVLCTIVALVTELLGRYCEHSINPKYGHFWCQVLTAVSVTIAMFCLIQFYIQTRLDLAEHKPFLKVLCIKLVIFFSFWQQLVISFLASQYGPLKPTDKLNAPDIYIGIPAVLICVEMAFFAVMHIFAFSYKPYASQRDYDTSFNATHGTGGKPKYIGGFLGIKAYVDAMNPWDFVKASARGFRWLFVGYKHRTKDPSYEQPGKVGTMDGYTGTLYGGPDTELHSTKISSPLQPTRPLRMGEGMSEDDRTGLLQHPAALSHTQTRTQSPYRNDSDVDWPLAAPPSGDLGSHTAYGYGKESDYGPPHHIRRESGSMHPALRPQAHDPQWEMFAGAGQPDAGYSANSGYHNQEHPARF